MPARFVPLVIPAHVGARSIFRRWQTLVGASALAVAGTVLTVAAPWRASEPSYRFAAVEARTIVRVVEATGNVEVRRRVEVPAPIGGHLVEVRVAAGTTVAADEVLARLDDRPAASEERAARAELQATGGRIAETRAALGAARDALQRTERLHARGLAGEGELIAARAARARSAAALETALAQRGIAGENQGAAGLRRDLHVIRAPVAGTILAAPESIGGMVGPERGALFVIAEDLDRLRVDAWVSEADVGALRVGQQASFSVPAYPGKVFHATLDRLGIDAARTGTRVRYKVSLATLDPEHLLRPGMSATIEIEVARVAAPLAAREAALRFAPDGASDAPARSRVWRHAGGDRLEAVTVDPGVSDGAFAEIRPADPAALRAGDEIAVGLAASEGTSAHGPGIRLGGR